MRSWICLSFESFPICGVDLHLKQIEVNYLSTNNLVFNATIEENAFRTGKKLKKNRAIALKESVIKISYKTV